jgi:hypothetical protein
VNATVNKENSMQNIMSPKSTLSPQSPRSVEEKEANFDVGNVDTSIEQLYDNVCEMQFLYSKIELEFSPPDLNPPHLI